MLYNRRPEDGVSTISTLIGAALGALVVGGFMMFWFSADNSAQSNSELSKQETAAVTALNRAGRDIAEARTVVKSNPRDFVVEKVTANTDNTQSVTRTRYVVAPRLEHGREVTVLVRQVDNNAPAVYADDTFVADSEQVLGRHVVVNEDGDGGTTFTYRRASGSTTSNPQEVGRVDIEYVAKTKAGKVELKSSASINDAIGGDGQRGGNDSDLDAIDDTIEVVVGQTKTVNVMDNDRWNLDLGDATVQVLSNGGFVGQINTGANPGDVSFTPQGLTQPMTYTVRYRLTDGAGKTDDANILVRVLIPVDPPAIGWNDICTTDGADDFTLVPRTGIVYLVSVDGGPYVLASGSTTVNDDGTTVSVRLRAEDGYVIRQGGTFVKQIDEYDTHEYTAMPCLVEPWVTNGVDYQNDRDGVNTIAFSGGQLEYRLVSGPSVPGQPDSGVVPAAAGMLRGQVEHAVKLNSQYEYTLRKTRGKGLTIDTDTNRPNGLTLDEINDQFPLIPAIRATGGSSRENTVTGLSTGGVVTDVDLRILQSYRVGVDVFLREQAYVENASGSYTDPASAGTEKVYFGVAQSRCRTSRNGALADCYSWGGGPTAGELVGQPDAYYNTGVARAYQTPADVPAGVTGGLANASDCFAPDGTTRTVGNLNGGGANNNAYHCATGQSNIAWTAPNADHGMPADSRFCSYPRNPGECEVQAARRGGVYQGATSPVVVGQSKWGTRDDYTVRSCNTAGCADGGRNVPLFSFAGPTTVTAGIQPEWARHVNLTTWYGGGCWAAACAATSDSQARFDWSNAAGDNVHYDYEAGIVGQAISMSGSTGDTSESQFEAITPGKMYRVRATGRPDNNNFWRRTAMADTADATFFSSPTHVSYLQDSPFCRPAENDGWTYGFAYKKQIIGANGGDVTLDYPYKVRHMWWLSKMKSGSGDKIGQAAAPYWSRTDATNGFAEPGDWTTSTVYWGFSGNQAADGTWTTQRVEGVIPPLGSGGNGGVAHLRVEVFVTRADVGNPHFGDLRYWTGPGTQAESADRFSGDDIRVRAEDITSTQVQNCAGNGNASNRWGTTGWSALANGANVTRRYDPLGPVSNRATPNPNLPGSKGWSEVY